MPFVNVKILENKLNEKEKLLLVEKLTGLIVDVMKRDRNLTTIVIDEIKPSSWAIGGKLITQEQNVSFVNIKVSKGTTNPEEISIMQKLVKELMESIMSNHGEANYFIIDELNSTGWGFGYTTMANKS